MGNIIFSGHTGHTVYHVWITHILSDDTKKKILGGPVLKFSILTLSNGLDLNTVPTISWNEEDGTHSNCSF